MKTVALALLFVAIQTPSQVPRKATGNLGKESLELQDKAHDNKTASTKPEYPDNPNHAEIPKQNSTNHATSDEDKSIKVRVPPINVNKDWADYLYILANLLLTAATFVIAIYAVVQASGAKASAKAALLNAQALINSERPWLFMTTNKPEINPRKNWFHISVVNRGRTPAEVTFYLGEFVFADPDSLSDTPTYRLAGHEFAHKKYLSPVDPPLEVYDFDCQMIIDDEQWRINTRDRKRLIIFGHVLYRDLITRDDHETRFCYLMSPVEGIGLSLEAHPNGTSTHKISPKSKLGHRQQSRQSLGRKSDCSPTTNMRLTPRAEHLFLAFRRH
jgi:hypothetical protein